MKIKRLKYYKKLISSKRIPIALFFLVLGLFLSFITLRLNTAKAVATAYTFTPVADSYVVETSASTNYGTNTQIRVDGSPLVRSYIKFNVANITGVVTKATFRVFANSNHTAGFTVHKVLDNTWIETGIVYANSPPIEVASSGSSGSLTGGSWYTIDITPLVTGNGTYSIALKTTNSTAMSLAGRESVNSPQLVVEEETAAPSPTPVPTPTEIPTPTPSILPTPTPAPGGDPIVFAVGDMVPGVANSCGSSNCKQMEVSQLILDASPAAYLALGDVQYEEGALSDFQTFYQPSYGRVKDITYPAVGNHEYLTPNAQGYFDYFNGVGNQTGPAGDRSKGYYAFNVGQWRIYALNTNCSKAGGCTAGSPQELWLKQDLAANPRLCSMMFYHHPYLSSDTRGFSYFDQQRALWDDFYAAGGDVVLVGHSHFYERYAPMNPALVQDDTYGIRQFIVGTGGKNIYDIGTQQPLSQIWSGNTFGALKMTLRDGSYEWRFIPIAGQTFTDAGTQSCHAAPPLTTPVPTPTPVPTGTPVPTIPPTPTPPASNVLTFFPIADTFLRSDRATTNYGASTGLEVDGSPLKKILMRFNVSGVGVSTIINAKIRIYNIESSNSGGSVKSVSDNLWLENAVTWNSSPVFGSSVGSLGSVSPNNWYEVNVTSFVLGDGLVSFGIDSTASNGADYSSKEGVFAPQLVVSLQ